jgi:HK97 gp10 family phage protein
VADAFEYKITGGPETARALAELGRRTRDKSAQASLRAAAKLVRSRAKTNAQAYGLSFVGWFTGPGGKRYFRTGRIPAALSYKVGKMRGQADVFQARISWRTIKGRAGRADRRNLSVNQAWYARFVELGVPQKGIAPRHFLQPALVETAQSAIDALVESLNQAIQSDVAAIR